MNRLTLALVHLLLVTLLSFPASAAEPPMAAKKELVAVIPDDFPPTYFRNPTTGRPAGLAVDVMDAVARQAGLTVTYRFAKPWQEIEDLVLQGKADLIPLRAMGESTTKNFLFTTAIDSNNINYIARADDKLRVGAKPESKIGVISGSVAYEYLKKHSYLHLKQYVSLEHLLIDLLSGQIDLILTVTPNLLQLAKDLGLQERIQVLEPAELEIKRSIALAHGNELLANRLNAAIVSFHASEESSRIYKKWLGKPKPYWTVKRTAIASGILLLAVIAAFTNWHITVLRRSNRKLKAEQSFLQTMMNAIPDFIFFKDHNSRYLGCNQSFAERVHGRSQETLVGLSDSDLHPQKELVEIFQRTDRVVMETGQPMKFEVAVPLCDGDEIRAEVIKTPFLDESGQIIGVIGIARDITERFQYLQQLEEAREKAEAANRAKSQFLANMSHEIRTPLNGVLGMAQLLAMSNLDQEQQEQLNMIQSSGNNLLAILNDILDLAKIEAVVLKITPAAFSPAELLEEVTSLYRHTSAQQGVELITDNDPGLPALIVGDPLRIKQILFNLAGNAFKFTRQGTVTLGCHVISATPEQIRLCFTVHDTGIGISCQDQERIFEPFEQVDNSNTRQYGGTGLGLAICQRLTQAMGGSLTLDSVVGQGSCFRLALDFQMAPNNTRKANEELKKTTSRYSDQALTILIAEDNEVNRFFLVKLLHQMGHQVLAAEDGQKALNLLEKQGCDLALLDIQMPVLDGSQVLQEIRRKDIAIGRHTPVIALTAHAMNGDCEKFLQQGFDGYLAKPLQTHDLETAIRRYSKRNQLP